MQAAVDCLIAANAQLCKKLEQEIGTRREVLEKNAESLKLELGVLKEKMKRYLSLANMQQEKNDESKKSLDELSLKILLTSDDHKNWSIQLEEARVVFQDKKAAVLELEHQISAIETECSNASNELENCASQDKSNNESYDVLLQHLQATESSLLESQKNRSAVLAALKASQYTLSIEQQTKNAYFQVLDFERESRESLEQSILTEIEKSELIENETADEHAKIKILEQQVEVLKAKRNNVCSFYFHFVTAAV